MPVDPDQLSPRQRELLKIYDVETQGARTDFMRALAEGSVEKGLEEGENYAMVLQLSPEALSAASRGV